jgi:hypothetical protein
MYPSPIANPLSDGILGPSHRVTIEWDIPGSGSLSTSDTTPIEVAFEDREAWRLRPQEVRCITCGAIDESQKFPADDEACEQGKTPVRSARNTKAQIFHKFLGW